MRWVEEGGRDACVGGGEAGGGGGGGRLTYPVEIYSTSDKLPMNPRDVNNSLGSSIILAGVAPLPAS